MIETLFFLPMAAGDIGRAVFTVRSIRAFSTDYRIYLLLDGPDPSELPAELAGADITVRPNRPPTGKNWGKIWHMQCSAMVEALADPQVSPQAIFVKIDADALLIRRGFTKRAQKIFSTRPTAGQIGQTFSNVRGGRLHNSGWANFVVKVRGWRGLLRFPLAALRAGEGLGAGFAAYAKYRALMKEAIANSYTHGEICLGGCNITRRTVIEAFARRGFLDKSPFRFLPEMGEDSIMTMHVYATGHAPVEDSADDGLFGVEVRGFRVDPFVLRDRGHYVLHPLKYGHNAHGRALSEAELVDALLAD